MKTILPSATLTARACAFGHARSQASGPPTGNALRLARMTSEHYVDRAHLAFEVKRFCRARHVRFADAVAPFALVYSVPELKQRRAASLEREKNRIVFKKDSVVLTLSPQPTWAEKRNWPTSSDPQELLHDQLCAAVDDAFAPAWNGRHLPTVGLAQAQQLLFLYWILTDELADQFLPHISPFQGLRWNNGLPGGRRSVARTWLEPNGGGGNDHAWRIVNLNADLAVRAFDEVRLAFAGPDAEQVQLFAPKRCAVDEADDEAGAARIGNGLVRDVRLDVEVRIAQNAQDGTPARPQPARGVESGVAEPSLGGHSRALGEATRDLRMTCDLTDGDKVRKAILTVRLDRGAGVDPVLTKIRGRTAAQLALLVISQPDQDHTWKALAATGNRARHWVITSPSSLARTGRRIQGLLPLELRARWSQGVNGVRWKTRD